ncbi:hypothetical protein PACILC2_30350 [Paenibacillus cisolokensis]|uniref:Uncharacterized protein n=1 Tax=Paenibacillus cisolokensis TaxID=1658519 RepID=A0ABQ4N8E7_9BACL|nr:hypothetical protein PACILC2_30350 [Paenibacillus cisolokensis]
MEIIGRPYPARDERLLCLNFDKKRKPGAYAPDFLAANAAIEPVQISFA